MAASSPTGDVGLAAETTKLPSYGHAGVKGGVEFTEDVAGGVECRDGVAGGVACLDGVDVGECRDGVAGGVACLDGVDVGVMDAECCSAKYLFLKGFGALAAARMLPWRLDRLDKLAHWGSGLEELLEPRLAEPVSLEPGAQSPFMDTGGFWAAEGRDSIDTGGILCHRKSGFAFINASLYWEARLV